MEDYRLLLVIFCCDLHIKKNQYFLCVHFKIGDIGDNWDSMIHNWDWNGPASAAGPGMACQNFLLSMYLCVFVCTVRVCLYACVVLQKKNNSQ